jgi:hypothetical protein
MAKADLIEPVAPHTSHSDGVGSVTPDKATKNDFRHVSDGNWPYTLKALEAYLASQGVPRHTYTAQLIMVMERSFYGKYRKGERSHYQRIMPDGKWRKGDTLSEKLTRSKDKETFKERFDRVGTTATLSRQHFDNYQIRNLDFKERAYLRLIDTNNGNVSIFFRNDAVADAFIKSALAFHREQLKVKRYKTLSVSAGKPAVVYLENPKPLLYTEGVQERAGRNKNILLTLVQPTYGKNKPQNQTPNPTDKETEGSGFGFSDQQVMESVGLCDSGTEQYKSVSRPRSAKPSNGAGTGAGVFKLWHESVAPKHPEELISAIPTPRDTHVAATICQKFNEFFPTEHVSDFFECLAANWKKARTESFPKWQLKNFGPYPTLSQLLSNWNPLLTWYKNERNRVAKVAEAARVSQERLQQQSQVEVRKSTPRPLAPFIGCELITASGRTFRQPCVESLEYQIAFDIDIGSRYGMSLRHTLKQLLKDRSIDMAASEARIEELRKMPPEEAEKYCC